MKTKKIRIPIFFGNLIVIKTKTLPEINSTYNTNINKNEHGAVMFRWDKKNGVSQYVVAFQGKKVDGSIIVHESVHVVNAIMEDRFIKPDLCNDETQAYLTGWVFDQINKFVNKK